MVEYNVKTTYIFRPDAVTSYTRIAVAGSIGGPIPRVERSSLLPIAHRTSGKWDKALAVILLILPGLISHCAAAEAAGGLVIYKEFPFDSDSQAVIAAYTSFEHFPSVDNVVTTDGKTLRILPGQEPTYIPAPASSGVTSHGIAPVILSAERRFPQYISKLEPIRRGWADAAEISVAEPKVSPIRRIPPASQATSPANPSKVLQTRSGHTYRSWKVSNFDGETVLISHADGISRIPISDLPNNLWGFPPEVVARVEQIHLQEAERLRKAPEKSAGPEAAAPKSGVKRR